MEQIFYNGKILTMAKKSRSEELHSTPEAILVRDGLIRLVGSLNDIVSQADKKAEKINLNKKCLMPSFIDAHSHFVMNGQMSLFADLSGCQSFEDIIDTLKSYQKENSLTTEDVLIGFGYDHNFLKENVHPDKRILDQVSTDIPIFVLHISGHLACANSMALKLSQITAGTLNPPGGRIGRLEDGREPNGYVEEAAMQLIQPALMPRIKADYSKMLRNMQEVYIANGITTVQDGATTENDLHTLLKLNASGHLNIDVVSYLLMSSGGDKLMEQYGETYKDYRNRLKIGGYKIILDGSPQGRSAWLSEPYAGKEEYCGYPWMTDEMVLNFIRRSICDKKQILAHCNGDAASEQFLTLYEKALKETACKEALRPVMIHCQTVRDDQLERMGKLAMIASFFVGHVWYWGDIHMKNLGNARGNHISPVKSALEQGVVINFHQDTPVTKPDMLHSVWCAVNRISRSGNIIGKEQAIDVYEALKAITINAAYQYGEEHSKGSIEVGKRADLVILDRSPLEVDSMNICNIKVLETIKDGRRLR